MNTAIIITLIICGTLIILAALFIFIVLICYKYTTNKMKKMDEEFKEGFK